MTKVTKTEKILRKATGKWEKFLAEGAFKKTVKEFNSDDAEHFDMKMDDWEYNVADDYKIGDKIMIRPPRKYLVDAEPGHEELQCRTGIVKAFDGKDKIMVLMDTDDGSESGEIVYIHGRNASNNPVEWKPPYTDCNKQVNEARMGEYGKIDAEDGNPPTKIGRGNEEYMAAYNAVLQARGEEPLDIQQPDQAYLDALQQGRMKPSDHSYNLEENEKKNFQVGEFVYVVNGSLKGASGKILEPVTTSTGEEGFAIELYSDAKMKVFGQRGDEVIALPQDLESGGTTDDMELYDIDEAVSGKEQYYLKQQNRAKGAAMALLDSAEEFSRMPSTEPASSVSSFVGRQANIIVDAMVALERMITSDSIDERSEDDERDLEEPVKFGSGAKLEFDPEEEKFYDRGRDMYIDDPEEEDNLTREGIPSSMRTKYSSDPEMNKIMDIAADMLNAGRRSRVSLVGVASALNAQGFDAKMEKGMLIIDDKYVIADKNSLPASAQKISLTKYAADYLSNLSGEQQNLPMDEQERPDFVTSYSSDPHLDQIEDYALTVIEKGGNLRQLEDVLNRDGFATFLNGDVLTIDDEFFIGKEENFDISPNEDIRRVGPYVVGYNK